MKEKPTALRLADELEEPIPKYPAPTALESAAAAELRRLHEANQAMLEALKSILEDMDSEHGTDYEYAKARAAIAKGEQA